MSDPTPPIAPVHFHLSLFLSDLHLGAIGSRTDLLLAFLKQNIAQCYVLVGDIIHSDDFIRRKWTASDQAVIDHLCERKNAGAKLIYIRGNHDPDPYGTPKTRQLPVEIMDQAVHEMADGREFLVVHGDAQDPALFQAPIIDQLGTFIHDGLRAVDGFISRHFGRPKAHRRSLIEMLLWLINWSLYATRTHERRMVNLAQASNVDGVICGHSHRPGIQALNGLVYANCGDWMDSFTALAESQSGRLQMMGGRKPLIRTRYPSLPLVGARS